MNKIITITQLIEELQDICGELGDIPVYIADTQNKESPKYWEYTPVIVDCVGTVDEEDICVVRGDY